MVVEVEAPVEAGKAEAEAGAEAGADVKAEVKAGVGGGRSGGEGRLCGGCQWYWSVGRGKARFAARKRGSRS